jgi:hypothetical protein
VAAPLIYHVRGCACAILSDFCVTNFGEMSGVQSGVLPTDRPGVTPTDRATGASRCTGMLEVIELRTTRAITDVLQMEL